MSAYGIAAPLSDYELDHLIPLELGGASTVANLWPEPLPMVPVTRVWAARRRSI